MRKTAAVTDPEDVHPVLTVDDMSVTFKIGASEIAATRGVSFSAYSGEILAIVGESGSGKSVSAMSVLDLLPRSATRQGVIELDGLDTSTFDDKRLRQMRGGDIAMIFQEPMTALNPVFTIGWQIIEMLRLHTDLSRRACRTRAVELLDLVGLPDPATRVNYYPHQLSGGQRQRAMIAMAISCDPKVLIADEPTTALDVTVQAEILHLLTDLRSRVSSAMVLITHDMGVVADVADRVIVMKDGEIVEEAKVDKLFASPSHPYTRQLLAAVPHLGHRPESGRLLESVDPQHDAQLQAKKVNAEAILELENIVVDYPGRIGQSHFRAVDGASLRINRGEVLGLVGESGSGKSTLGRVVVGLQSVTSGQVVVAGQDITDASRRQLRPLRRRIGMVFQDPAASLNPRYTIADSISEPLRLHRMATGRGTIDARVIELLESVELSPSWRHRFSHELSGGQRQRVAIARALAAQPELLVADEPTSALDVSVQAHLLDLLLDLQERMEFSCLFISHDLAVVELLADRMAVMSAGKIVEQGSREQILNNPTHTYTKQLVAAAPVPDPTEQRRRRAELAPGAGVG
ncbi:ABC transporter ATP-binding protein [Arthrobacter pigmenti]